MNTSLTVNNFQKILKEEITTISSENGWSFNNSAQRGMAFQHWTARLLTNIEPFDTEPEEAILYSKDLGADIILEDSASKRLILCQCKYQAPGSKADEGMANDFFQRHRLFKDKSWVISHGSKDAQLALRDYSERVQDGYAMNFIFVTTGDATTRTLELAQKCSESYVESGDAVTCQVIDFSKLKEYYTQSLSLEQSIPEVVELDLPTGQFFAKNDPFPTIVAVVKGNLLQNLSKRYRQALYAWNIRGYLGNRGINQQISETAKNNPGEFFYYNNGVSAICTKLEINDNKIRAHKFQIINGAQTVSSLGNVSPNPSVEVLLRLTQTQSVSTEKGFNKSIIEYNNSQNSVKISDFRSNDPIQVFLERSIPEVKHYEGHPDFFYLRKRAVGKRGTGYGIKLEDLAKIRYSFLYEPTLVHAAPKSLWTVEEDGGVYEKAFGIEGQLQPAWPEEALEECIFAVMLTNRINDVSSALSKGSEENRFLPRCKYHSVSLLGQISKSQEATNFRKLVRNNATFEDFWNRHWQQVRDIITDTFTDAQEQGLTLFAFVRSGKIWKRMETKLRRRLA